MNKILALKLNWIAFFIVFILVFLMVVKVHAESPSTTSANQTNPSELAAKKYGITFPIPELGNCGSFNECRNFCEDAQNKDVCINFAKKKGFYKEHKTDEKNAILNAAKHELGCDSEDSCKQFCGEQQNWEKCGEFAKKHKLSGGQVEDSSKKDILEKAQNFLGCDSYQSCKNFCQQEANRKRCDEFAKLVGLKGGVEHKGPQPSPAYENASEKARFCREFPQKCQNATSSGVITPEQYCKEHPERCPKPYSPSPSASTTCQPPSGGCGAYNYWDSSRCSCRSYQDYCQSKQGCSWTGTTCQCSSTTSQPTTSGNTGTSSSVKGISTVRSFLQTLLDWLRQ